MAALELHRLQAVRKGLVPLEEQAVPFKGCTAGRQAQRNAGIPEGLVLLYVGDNPPVVVADPVHLGTLRAQALERDIAPLVPALCAVGLLLHRDIVIVCVKDPDEPFFLLADAFLAGQVLKGCQAHLPARHLFNQGGEIKEGDRISTALCHTVLHFLSVLPGQGGQKHGKALLQIRKALIVLYDGLNLYGIQCRGADAHPGCIVQKARKIVVIVHGLAVGLVQHDFCPAEAPLL